MKIFKETKKEQLVFGEDNYAKTFCILSLSYIDGKTQKNELKEYCERNGYFYKTLNFLKHQTFIILNIALEDIKKIKKFYAIHNIIMGKIFDNDIVRFDLYEIKKKEDADDRLNYILCEHVDISKTTTVEFNNKFKKIKFVIPEEFYDLVNEFNSVMKEIIKETKDPEELEEYIWKSIDERLTDTVRTLCRSFAYGTLRTFYRDNGIKLF